MLLGCDAVAVYEHVATRWLALADNHFKSARFTGAVQAL